jgi:hypothetical protein
MKLVTILFCIVFALVYNKRRFKSKNSEDCDSVCKANKPFLCNKARTSEKVISTELTCFCDDGKLGFSKGKFKVKGYSQDGYNCKAN